jgi:hypothetical protein
MDFARNSGGETFAYALENIVQAGLRNAVINFAPFAILLEQPAVLQQPQVARRLRAGNIASRGQFAHRVTALQKHLHHPQTMGMGQRFQAFGRLGQNIEAD